MNQWSQHKIFLCFQNYNSIQKLLSVTAISHSSRQQNKRLLCLMELTSTGSTVHLDMLCTVTTSHHMLPKLPGCVASPLWSRHNATADARCLCAAWHVKTSMAAYTNPSTPLSLPPLILLSLLSIPSGRLQPSLHLAQWQPVGHSSPQKMNELQRTLQQKRTRTVGISSDHHWLSPI